MFLKSTWCEGWFKQVKSNYDLLSDPMLVIDELEHGGWTFCQAYSSITYLHIVVHMGPAETITFLPCF